MKVSSYDINSNEVVVESEPAGKIIKLIFNDDIYDCELWEYTPLYNTFSDGTTSEWDGTPLKAFVNFFQGKLCVFYNGGKQILTNDDLSPWGEDIMDYYWTYGNLFSLSSSFNSKVFWFGDRSMMIDWKLAEEFSYEVDDGSGNCPDHYLKQNPKDKPLPLGKVTINKPLDMTKIEAMSAVLEKELSPEINDMINGFSEDMNLWDLLDFFVIQDPSNADWTSGDNPDPVYPTGVFGCSYKTNSQSFYVTQIGDDNNNTNKSVLFLSPIIYFLDPKEMRSLVVHELCHIKIGVDHGHDSYFWYLFEKYSKLSRKDDSSYNQNQELDDNDYFNEYCRNNGPSVEELIEADKEYSNYN